MVLEVCHHRINFSFYSEKGCIEETCHISMVNCAGMPNFSDYEYEEYLKIGPHPVELKYITK